MTRQELEQRLINFSVITNEIADALPKKKTASNLSGQLARSCTSAALNYGEAQSGESRKDFIHKLKVVLKELRESYICLRIIDRGGIMSGDNQVLWGIKESDELIAIF